MTEIQPFQNAPLATQSQSDKAIDSLLKQAQAMEAAHRLGSALASTDIVPVDYKGKPDNATAAILFGAELGLSAVQSLQNIFVVRGKPAMYARTMTALVISQGHHLGEIEATPDSVTWTGRRGDNGQEFTSTWTMERAEQAKFTSNDKYKTQPIEMLRAKAQTEVCRTLFSDVLLGMSHSVEDIDLEPMKVISEQVRPPRRGVAGLKAALAPASTPEPVQDNPDKETTEPEKATRDQQVRIAELLDAEGVKTKAAKLDYLQGQFGASIKSAADVTAEQATALIAFLEQPEGPDAE